MVVVARTVQRNGGDNGINQKVLTKEARIDEMASARVFSETTGAMHPTAEGHAAMADAILMDLRSAVRDALE